MTFRKHVGFLKHTTLFLGLFQVLACTGVSEPKEAVEIYAEPEHKTKTVYKLEKISEISQPYTSEICHIEVDPDNKESVLAWTKSKTKQNDNFVDRLAWWKGEENLSLGNLNISSEPIVALGNFHHGNVNTVSIKADKEDNNSIEGHFILNTALPSEMPIRIDLTGNQTTYTHKSGCALYPVKLRILANGNIAALVKAHDSLELSIYESSGAKIWTKVLQSEFHPRRAPTMDNSVLSLSREGRIAVYFESLKGSTGKTLMVFNANGQVLKTETFKTSNPGGMTWLDEENIAVLEAKRVGTDPTRKDIIEIHVVPVQESRARNTTVLDMKSSLVSLNSFKSVDAKKVLITGQVDFYQVRTGSSIAPGKAFVGVYDIEEQQFVFEERISSLRDNKVTTATEYGPGEFLIATTEGPLTHEEGRASAFLYHLRATK